MNPDNTWMRAFITDLSIKYFRIPMELHEHYKFFKIPQHSSSIFKKYFDNFTIHLDSIRNNNLNI